MKWFYRCLCLSLLLTSALAYAGNSEQALVNRLKQGDAVLMVRHALAPGTGDPDNFTLGQCETQRNLNDTGRQQARAMGDWLRGHGIEHSLVYSSQWCRCLETAQLMQMGEVHELPALNSFYEMPADREPNLSALRTLLSKPDLQSELIILVTHQVTVSAHTGMFIDSGHGAVFIRGDTGSLDYLGELEFGY